MLPPSRPPTSSSQILDDRWGGSLLGCVPKCPGLWSLEEGVQHPAVAMVRKGDPLGGAARIEAGRGLAVGSLEWMPVCLGPVMGAPRSSLWVCPWEGTAVTLCPCHIWLKRAPALSPSWGASSPSLACLSEVTAPEEKILLESLLSESTVSRIPASGIRLTGGSTRNPELEIKNLQTLAAARPPASPQETGEEVAVGRGHHS